MVKNIMESIKRFLNKLGESYKAQKPLKFGLDLKHVTTNGNSLWILNVGIYLMDGRILNHIITYDSLHDLAFGTDLVECISKANPGLCECSDNLELWGENIADYHRAVMSKGEICLDEQKLFEYIEKLIGRGADEMSKV